MYRGEGWTRLAHMTTPLFDPLTHLGSLGSTLAGSAAAPEWLRFCQPFPSAVLVPRVGRNSGGSDMSPYAARAVEAVARELLERARPRLRLHRPLFCCWHRECSVMVWRFAGSAGCCCSVGRRFVLAWFYRRNEPALQRVKLPPKPSSDARAVRSVFQPAQRKKADVGFWLEQPIGHWRQRTWISGRAMISGPAQQELRVSFHGNISGDRK